MTGNLIPNEVLHQMDALLLSGERRVIAIDGRCASGKTSLAETMSRHYNCNVIHMDHFFLRPERGLRPGVPGEMDSFGRSVFCRFRSGKSM